MALIDRFLAGLFAVVVLALAVLVLALAGGWQLPPGYGVELWRDPNARWGGGIVAALFLLGALRLLFGGLSRPQETRALVQSTPLGEVRVTLQALENLVERTAHQFRGIQEVKPRLQSTPAGVLVAVRVTVVPEVKLPALTGELQEKIAHTVEEMAGIQVLEVRVLVENISRETRGRVE